MKPVDSIAPAEPGLDHDALLRVAAAAAGASGLEDVLELAAEEALRAIDAASLSVSRWEKESGAIRTLINVGDLGPGEQRFPTDETYAAAEYPFIAEMIHGLRPYFNSLDDENCEPLAAELLRKVGKSSDLGVPIMVEGEAWGEVWATKAVGDLPFRSEDVSFLEAIAGQFAIAIARAELFSRVSRLAYEDSLTGLPNRRALDERLGRALGRVHGEGPSVVMLLCDFDELKRINDSRGHEAGDASLRRAADALVAAAADRPGAFVARVSGDEFCVLLEDRRLEDGVAVGAAAISNLSGQGLSLSCGAAIARDLSTEPVDLLKAADSALYAAKRRGGGQVCSASERPTDSTGRRRLRGTTSWSNRIAATTSSLVAELDGPLATATVLDRLEAVASAYTEAADLAGWTVSVAAAGRDVLTDLSTGDNRNRDLNGIRIGPGTKEYKLEDYPATERAVAQGSGFYIASRSDPESDRSERELLTELGFESVLGVTVAHESDIYLIEIFGDRPGDPLAKLAIPLRLTARAAVPPPTGARRRGRSGPRSVGGSELSLAVAKSLDQADSVEVAIQATAEELQRAFCCHVVHVIRCRDGALEVWAESGRVRTRAGWTQRSDAGLVGRCLLEQQPVVVADVRRDPQFRGTEVTREVRSELAVPVRVAGSVWGVLNLEHTEVDYFDHDDARLVQAIAAQLGNALQALELYASLERAYMGTAEALSAALEAKDPYTARHSHSIAKPAEAVGRRLGMDRDELRTLRYGAAFHDIGKLATPRSILHKPGPLTDEERAMLAEHTVIGERILAPIEFLRPVLPLVRHAHERWDGRGYPDGLAGEAIPLGARVLFGCDAHDTMTTDRPYRAAMTEQAACEELRKGAGSQFDPAVVEALLAVLAH